MRNWKWIRLLSLALCAGLALGAAGGFALAEEAGEGLGQENSPSLVLPMVSPEPESALPGNPAEQAPEVQETAEPLFGDVNGDGAVDLRDLQQLISEGNSLRDAQKQMPLRLLDRDVKKAFFQLELWSDAQGTEKTALSDAELAQRGAGGWQGAPAGEQCTEEMAYYRSFYPSISGYTFGGVTYRGDSVYAIGMLSIGSEEYAYVYTGATNRRLSVLSAGSKIVVRYVADSKATPASRSLITVAPGSKPAEAPTATPGPAATSAPRSTATPEARPTVPLVVLPAITSAPTATPRATATPKPTETTSARPTVGMLWSTATPSPAATSTGSLWSIATVAPTAGLRATATPRATSTPAATKSTAWSLVATATPAPGASEIWDALAQERGVSIQLLYDGELTFGSEVTMVAMPYGYDNVDYELQWETSRDDATWRPVENGAGAELSLVITEENYRNYWRVQVTITGVRGQ